ncbi:hypothetical protein Q0Z83_042430 [Actinoplanes sichuanensis]|nr:hypothetical protein Q0Z83_042430 [Actinoplanes sichuanensis]
MEIPERVDLGHAFPAQALLELRAEASFRTPLRQATDQILIDTSVTPAHARNLMTSEEPCD